MLNNLKTERCIPACLFGSLTGQSSNLTGAKSGEILRNRSLPGNV